MKVAINTRFLLADRLEGIGRYTHEICKRIVASHPEVEFHFLFDRPFDERFIYNQNVEPHVLFPPARHPYLWRWWFERSVPRILKKINADVFFSPDGYLSLSSRVPSAMTTHDLAYAHYPEHIRSSHLKYFKKNVPLFHHRADKIICVSESTRHDVLTKFNSDKEKAIVIPNGVNTRFRPMTIHEKTRVKEEISGGSNYILIIGAIHPRKNIVRQIKAFEQFKIKSQCSTKLILAGRWAWKYDEVRSAIKNSRYRESIIHLSDVNDMVPVLGAASAMSYVSLYEGFGMPILEAFRAEVPVITSNLSSMPEVAGSGAILVDPFSIEDIARGMLSVVKDDSKRIELIMNGSNQVQKFSWDNSAEQVFEQLATLSMV